MKTILVSGASGIVGYGILRSLKHYHEPLHLIGTSIYTDSAANGFCNTFELAPKTSEDHYLDWLLSIIKQYKVDFIIPGIETDLHKWNEFRNQIAKTNAIALLNKPELVNLCTDKWLFHEALSTCLQKYQINSSIANDYDELIATLGLPFLLKPRCGFGSKGIVRIDSKESFAHFQANIGNHFMAQAIVGTDDDEFTVSAFCDGIGGFYTHIIMKRKLSKDGFTDRAEVVNDKNIGSALYDLCQFFQPIGPTNFQFRKHGGALKLLEINPRISSSTSIRAAFGYNEAIMALDYYLNQQPPNQPAIRMGRAVRYIEDMIFMENERE